MDFGHLGLFVIWCLEFEIYLVVGALVHLLIKESSMAKVLPKKWIKEEDNFIKKNYLKMDNKALAIKFGVTLKSIEGKIRRMKLKRPKPAEKKNKKRKPLIIHQNIRCRTCFLVDGYTEAEKKCRYCGAKLFKFDTI